MAGIGGYIASEHPGFPRDFFSNNTATYDTIEERPLEPFKSLTINGFIDVIGVKSDTNYLRLETNAELAPDITTNQQNGQLSVNIDYNGKRTRRMATRSVMYVYFTDLEKLDLSDAISFHCSDTLKSPQFYVQLAGASKADLRLTTHRTTFEMLGASQLSVAGQSAITSIDASGASKIAAVDFVVDSMKINVAGGGKIEVCVNKHLQAHVSGAAVLKYKGNPSLDVSKRGPVKIKKIE